MAEKYLSFSAEDQFENCERRYYHERIEGRRSADTAPLVVGDVYHKVLADYWRRAKEVALETIVAGHVTAEASRLEAVGVDCAAFRGELLDNAERVVKALFKPGGVEPIWHDGEPVIERDFAHRGLMRRGVIDIVSARSPLVDGAGNVVGFVDEPCVLDYKSTGSDRRRSERDARVSEQLALYAAVVQVRRAGFIEIPRNTGRPLNVRMATYDDRELERFVMYAKEIREAILSRGKDKLAYKRTSRSNPLCSALYCPFYLTDCYPNENNTLPKEV